MRTLLSFDSIGTLQVSIYYDYEIKHYVLEAEGYRVSQGQDGISFNFRAYDFDFLKRYADYFCTTQNIVGEVLETLHPEVVKEYHVIPYKGCY